MTSDHVEPSGPPERASSAETTQPGAGQSTPNPSTPAEPPAPRVKIGTQRPGSARIKAAPRPQPIFERRSPFVAPATGEQTAAEPPPARPVRVVDEAAIERELERPLPEPPAAAIPSGGLEAAPVGGRRFPVPNIRNQLPPELEQEVEDALGGLSLDEVLEPGKSAATKAEFEPESRHQARVVSIHREDVFVDLGGRNQGVLPLKMFAQPPVVGAALEVSVVKFDSEEGLYQLSMPGAAISAANWGDLAEGVLVEARVTGHNKGGLECEVNNIRAFIPASQIAPFRVEDFSQFVGEKLTCVVTEANPARGNLVLSRRGVLEREQAAAKEKLRAELAEGQIREGTVRSITDFGAFVDLGGVDGLLHVSQLSWQRVKHPSDVLTVGQPVRVMIRKIDPTTHKISLAMRDLLENPWKSAAAKYTVGTKIQGVVSKVMEFGAFVQLEPGVEGLVHISELAHQRVWRTADVIQEGQTVEAKILSIDPEQQRIGLSIKALAARPVPIKKEEEDLVEETPPPSPSKPRKTPLKGGIGQSSGGEKFGLKW